MHRFNKIFLTVSLFFLSACNLTPTLPEAQKVQSDYGVWAIPLSLHSTVLTRQLTASGNLEFKYKKLDGSLKENITQSKFLHQPSFHFVELPAGRYILQSSRIIGKENWYSENINFDIKAGHVTVHPLIYAKERYRLDSRHYREEFNTYEFEGERAKIFIQKMETDERISQWKINWPKL